MPAARLIKYLVLSRIFLNCFRVVFDNSLTINLLPYMLLVNNSFVHSHIPTLYTNPHCSTRPDFVRILIHTYHCSTCIFLDTLSPIYTV